MAMEHSDLVTEIATVEKMSTADRLKHAKKRRQQQLKKFAQYEKALEKESNKKRKMSGATGANAKKTRNPKVQFINNVMLLEAAARNDIEEVRYLLMQGVSPDVTNEDGLTALHQCCIDDLEGMMKLLIEFGANVNARDSELWTPLHAAATCGHVHLCKYLVENGAELLSVNADGNMPYDICEDEVTLDYIESEMAKRGVTQELIDDTRLSSEKLMLDDLRHLVKNNGDLEFRGRCGETALHIAAANGYIRVTEYLLENHVAVDAVDEDLWQPIHCAACWGQLPVIEVLMQNGADLEVKTKTGETPFDICEDLELKQRLMEMKDELESNRATRKQDLRHRRSQNTRSASVRRTSMREKSAISWKEAREEAQRLRETAGDEDEDEDEGRSPPAKQVKQEQVPTTNIDDVQVNLSDDEPAVVTPIGNIESSKESHTHKIHGSKDNVNKAPGGTGVSNKAGNKSLGGALQDNNMNNKVQQAAPPPTAPATKNVVNKAGSQSSTTTTTTVTNKVTTGTSVVQNAQSSPANTKRLPAEATNNSTSEPHNLAPPPSKGVSESSLGSSVSTPSKNSELLPSQPQDGSSRKGSEGSLMTPLTGTLADLKKQRAQRLQDALRSRDGSLAESPSYTNVNNVTPENGGGSNGHATSTKREPNGVQSGNAYGGRPGEAPKHKYTATTEIVGGNSSDTSCCIIL